MRSRTSDQVSEVRMAKHGLMTHVTAQFHAKPTADCKLLAASGCCSTGGFLQSSIIVHFPTM